MAAPKDRQRCHGYAPPVDPSLLFHDHQWRRPLSSSNARSGCSVPQPVSPRLFHGSGTGHILRLPSLPRQAAHATCFLGVLKGGKLLWPEKEASIQRGLFNLLQTAAYIRRARRPREYIIIALPWNTKNLLTACSYDGIHKNLPLLLVDFERKELQILFEQRDEARKVAGLVAAKVVVERKSVSGIGSGISGEWFRRFHPTCMGMIIDQAKKLDNFLCLDCAEENDTKRASNSYQTSPNYDSKVVFITRFKVCSDYLSNHDDGFFYQLVLRYTGDEVQSPVHTSIDVTSQPLAQEEFCGKFHRRLPAIFETNRTKENGNHRPLRMFHLNSPIGIHTQNIEFVLTLLVHE